MINKIDNTSFTGVKYTAGGKRFLAEQTQETQDYIKKAEKKMKRYRHTNLVVNKNGFAVQKKDIDGIHSFKIDDVMFSIYNDIIFHLSGRQGKTKLSFYLDDYHYMCQDAQRNASYDALDKNGYARSAVLLTDFIEKNWRYPI